MSDPIDNLNRPETAPDASASNPSAASSENSAPPQSFWGRKRTFALACLFLLFAFVSRIWLGLIAMGMKGVLSGAAISAGCLFVFYVAPFSAVLFSALFVAKRRAPALYFWRIVGVVVLLASVEACWTPIRAARFSIKAAQRNRIVDGFREAVFNGDGVVAVKFAEEMEKADAKPSVFSAKRRGIAFELNGDYEQSLTTYRGAPGVGDSYLARVYYRLDRRAEAFGAYCRFAETATKAAETADPIIPNRETVAAAIAKRRVLFAVAEDAPSKLDPFADYAEFLRFIEAEYERADAPEQYEKAVQFWREAARAEIAPPVPVPYASRMDWRPLSDLDYLGISFAVAERDKMEQWLKSRRNDDDPKPAVAAEE